jgi:hypothetical protein
LRAGDVIEVSLSGPKVAYLQDLGIGWATRIARFLPGIFLRALNDDALRTLVAGDSLYRAPCLTEFLVNDGYGRTRMNLPIPQREIEMPALLLDSHAEDWRNWWVLDHGKEIRAAEYLDKNPAANICSMPHATDLPGSDGIRARIEAGWTPGSEVPLTIRASQSRSRFTQDNRSVTRPRTAYWIYFSSMADARSFIDGVEFDDVSISEPRLSDDDQWLVEIQQERYLNRKLDERLRGLASTFGGAYDGYFDMSS